MIYGARHDTMQARKGGGKFRPVRVVAGCLTYLSNRASGFFSISSLLSLSLMIVITICNMAKSGQRCVLSDCITSYDKKKLPEMLNYYESKGCSVQTLDETMQF